MGFGDPQLPGQPRVLYGRLGRSAGSAVVAADQNYVSVTLGYAGRDRTHADLRHQLYVNPGVRVNIFQVVDQLGQIFDGVNIVVGRRGDKLNARRGTPYPSDVFVNLVAGKLAALTGFGALGHLDLQISGVDQVVRRDTEPSRRHLFDCAATKVSVLVGCIPVVVFSTLSSIAARSDAVHGNGHGLVGFSANGTQGRRAGGEPFHNFRSRLYFLDGDGRPVLLEIQQAAQSGDFPALVIA